MCVCMWLTIVHRAVVPSRGYIINILELGRGRGFLCKAIPQTHLMENNTLKC